MLDSFEEIALHQSIIRRQWLPLDVAVEELIKFENHFGTGHFLLACHAALPSLLTPDLLHSIRVNFLDQQKPPTPWIAEMDFLLSPLCRPLEKDVFEVEPMAREALLFKLEERYHWPQLQHIADFLLQYLDKKHTHRHDAHIAQLHKWIALSYLQPDQVVQELLHLLNESVDTNSSDYQTLPKKLRIARTMELLADPLRYTMLQEEYSNLVHSARVLAYTLYNSKETFPATIRATNSASRHTSNLFPPALQQWLSTITVPQSARTVESTNPENNANIDADLSSPATFDQPTTLSPANTATSISVAAREEGRTVAMLKQAGWLVQTHRTSLDTDPTQGIAVLDLDPNEDFTVYLLLIDNVEIGVIVIEETTSTEDSMIVAYEHHSWNANSVPFVYRITGSEIQFTNTLEREARSRHLFHFHRPETLAAWLKLAPVGTPNSLNNLLRSRLRYMRPIPSPQWLGEIPTQVNAEIEKSLATNHPRVLVQMPNGSGKTRILINQAYQLLAYAGAERVLYLVRSSVERATYRKFDQFTIPDTTDKFINRFKVQILENRTVDATSKVCIATIEQFYSAFSGVQLVYNVHSTSQESSSNQEQTAQRPTNESINIQYNPIIPIEFFDIILIDDCAPDTYQRWRPLLEYFDALIIGATSNTNDQELSFFHNNLVYTHPQQNTLTPTTTEDSSSQIPFSEDDETSNLDPEENLSQDELEALLTNATVTSAIKRGDIVDGVIMHIDPNEILVDIGAKSEGVLSPKELPTTGYGSFDELYVNDKVLVYVLQPETQENRALLSLKRASTELHWRTATTRYQNNELFKARVIDFNKGGLIVDAEGIRGFVPVSQILNFTQKDVAAGESQENETKLKSMKGKELRLKIIELNQTRNRLILSERLATQEWRQRRREELLDELTPGEVRKGVVSNLANFGAFIDLGGADGLVHVSQLAWSKIKHPSEILHIGQEVEVQVMSIDKEKKKIALSVKRAEVDPWTTAEQRYTAGQMVTGIVTKISPFGAFARIEDGIEALVHKSEFPPETDAKTFLQVGTQRLFRILRIDTEKRRIGLSLLQPKEVEGEGEETEPVAIVQPIFPEPITTEEIEETQELEPSDITQNEDEENWSDDDWVDATGINQNEYAETETAVPTKDDNKEKDDKGSLLKSIPKQARPKARRRPKNRKSRIQTKNLKDKLQEEDFYDNIEEAELASTRTTSRKTKSGHKWSFEDDDETDEEIPDDNT